MQSIESAAEGRFESSTVEELKEYAKGLGIDEQLKGNESSDKIRAMLLTALGLAVKGEVPKPLGMPRVVNAGEAIFPEYNLSPVGLWGGRRHRIKLPRPEGSKMANAEGFGWNGKETYYIAYDEVTNVPEPILNILRTNKRRRSYQNPVAMPDGSKEITTAWAFDDIAFSYLGVDPDTAERAGSLLEWYQRKGPSWFNKRSLRELQLIAGKIELVMRHPGKDGKTFDHDEACAAMKTFFFGYPDAIEETA